MVAAGVDHAGIVYTTQESTIGEIISGLMLVNPWAMATRDVSELLKFGPKAAQAVAQPLKMDPNPVRCSVPNLTKEASEAYAQAYAILQLNRVMLRSQ